RCSSSGVDRGRAGRRRKGRQRISHPPQGDPLPGNASNARIANSNVSNARIALKRGSRGATPRRLAWAGGPAHNGERYSSAGAEGRERLRAQPLFEAGFDLRQFALDHREDHGVAIASVRTDTMYAPGTLVARPQLLDGGLGVQILDVGFER